MSELKIYQLCHFASERSLYTSWVGQCANESVVVDRFPHDWQPPADAGIVVSHMHYRWDEMTALRRIYEQNRVPVLILADGILEYRNTWEHPDLPDGSIFQPVIGHKLACIGRGQVRIVESWGNSGKCELVGMPRLDPLAGEIEQTPVRRDGPFRVLIATAKTPSFDDRQRTAVIESLTHIRDRLAANPRVNGREMQVTWRLTDGLEEELGVAVDSSEERIPLTSAIDQSDAVITTPSTLFLESLLRKRPTGLLDFHNSPQYIPSAWTINAPKHLNWILRELENPPAAKMLFQNHVLDDQLFCRTPSAPRMVRLVTTMIEQAAKMRSEGRPLKFADRILTDPECGFAPVAEGFDHRVLYPENRFFRDPDEVRMRMELEHATKRLDTAFAEIAEKAEFIDQIVENLDAARLRAAVMKGRAIDSHSRFETLRDKNKELVERLREMQQRLQRWKKKSERDAAAAAEPPEPRETGSGHDTPVNPSQPDRPENVDQ